MSFMDSLDIANRALFHLGATRIQSPSEDSKNNTTMAFLYDKLRPAELRRNVWRFATRRAVMRPVDPTTLKLVPSAWNSTTLYLPGAIVADANNVFWQSTQAENLGNIPGFSTSWFQYFGPLTATLFASVTNYTAWSSGTTYALGAQVSYNGIAYQSTTNANLNNIPNAPSSSFWFAITVLSPQQQGFYAGELVYLPTGTPGGYQVYMSLVNGNSNVPSIATAWSSTTQYTPDQCVSYLGAQYRNLLTFNQNITPAASPANWSASTTYALGNAVTGSDHIQYTSNAGGNFNNNPVTDGGINWTSTGIVSAWSSSPTLTVADIGWLPLNVTLTNLTFVYPIGSGPSTDAATRNVFHLPAHFMREAPQDPKRGSVSFLGAPSGLMYTDWEFEGDFMVSRDAEPIVFRFVADVYQVSAMDQMFCEGLAARMAYEACEDLTQSIGKQQACAQAYKTFMGDARTVNGIETGATEPPEDDYITCRV